MDTIIQQACDKIPPMWPLENFVAVNPYQGLADHSFQSAAILINNLAGIQMTMPLAFYLEAIEKGVIGKNDIEEVLSSLNNFLNADEFIKQIKEVTFSKEDEASSILAVHFVTKYTGMDWNSFMTERITSWASDYFDKGQVLWHTTDRALSPYASWKKDALSDAAPKLMGLKNFKNILKQLSDNTEEAIYQCLIMLKVNTKNQEIYLHSLLLNMSGWSSYIAGLDWDNKLYHGNGGMLPEFLAVLLSWEVAILESFKDIKTKWEETLAVFSKFNNQNPSSILLQQKLILQQAYDHASQRLLIDKFKSIPSLKTERKIPLKVQAVFCIDVRSEIFRRNLEAISSQIETLGFAGFFAFPIKYIPLGYDEGINQCPVLIPTGPVVRESMMNNLDNEAAVKSRKISHQIRTAWKSFKYGAVSCFSFVSPLGLSYLPKLFTDSFGITRPVGQPDEMGLNKKFYGRGDIMLGKVSSQDDAGIGLEDQVRMAKSALQAMSFTKDFARLVLIVGHGSTSVNNPHATGLDCGACGGHTGEVNAKVASAVLNNKAVRNYLALDGIHIPDDTIFIPCLHDTTTDEVSLYGTQHLTEGYQNDLLEVKAWLAKAGHAARVERSYKFSIHKNQALDKAMRTRSTDWSQVRPEWGLAGCNAFIVAPRIRTQNMNLEGKSFLHSYEWKDDKNFKVLELIMTAPMVVTSWINLQYYASTVDNKHNGSGNKTLHNITGGIGVLEGYSGDLRTGLPWQSVHDGIQYHHLPQRLNIVIEAPVEAMNMILNKHTNIKQLCDNSWIYLFGLNESGHIAYKYAGNLQWENLTVYKESEIAMD